MLGHTGGYETNNTFKSICNASAEGVNDIWCKRTLLGLKTALATPGAVVTVEGSPPASAGPALRKTQDRGCN
jgi:hypothetical protein